MKRISRLLLVLAVVAMALVATSASVFAAAPAAPARVAVVHAPMLLSASLVYTWPTTFAELVGSFSDVTEPILPSAVIIIFVAFGLIMAVAFTLYRRSMRAGKIS